MARLRGRSGFLTSVNVGAAREVGAVASSGVLIGFWGPGGRASAEAVASILYFEWTCMGVGA